MEGVGPASAAAAVSRESRLRPPALRAVIGLLLFLSLPAGLTAQEADRAGQGASAENLPTGVVMGRVTDALRGEPLAGLEVRVEGTELSTRTDGTGEFVLWEVPAGTHRLRVLLPPVPGLGALTLETEVRVEAGRIAEVRFERPGPVEHRDLLCGGSGEAGGEGAGDRGQGTAVGALVGRVTEPGSGESLQGAEVAFSWRGLGTQRLAALLGEAARKAENRYALATDSAGRFAACGVPLGRPVELRVGATVRAVTLTPERPFRILELSAAEAAGARVTTRREAEESSLVGYVRSAEDDRPLVGARVRLLDAGEGEREVATRRGGFFRLAPVEPGTHRIEVSRVGSGSDTVFVRVEAGTTTVLRLAMKTDPVELPELTATVERTVRQGQIRDFYRRMGTGNGGFITAEEVQRSGVLNALRMEPRTTIAPDPGRCGSCYQIKVTRGIGSLLQSCEEPAIYLDGMRLTRDGGVGTFEDMVLDLNPRIIEGIEVHTPSTVPPQYGGVGSACGVLLVWTTR